MKPIYFLIVLIFITGCSGKGFDLLDEYRESIDYSCTQDSDCVVKDVHNCCGYQPACVNSDAQVDPDYVREVCKKYSLSSGCGFDEITGCKCVNNTCEHYYEE